MIKKIISVAVLLFTLNCIQIYSFAPQDKHKSQLTNRSASERIIEPEIKATPNPQEIKIQKINKILGGGLKNKGEIIVQLSEKYKVNPYVVTAIMIHETANGRSKFCKDYNNTGGLYNSKGKLSRFKTLDDGIKATIKNLKANYIDYGLDSLELIQKKYAPIGAKNDPNDLNKCWLAKVKYYYDLLIN